MFYTLKAVSGSQNMAVEDDGLICPDVGSWAEEKYRLLALYDELFSTGMKYKWDQRVYIDLYAGAGYARVKGTKKILKGSPVLALGVTHPFDKYILCEESSELLGALRARVTRIAPQATVAYVPGDCDSQIAQICREIPKGSATNKVLSLCLVDPFDFGLKFETLKRLSGVYIDFVVLLAIGMDANRNYDHYVDGNSPKIDEALGSTEWRERWKSGRRPPQRLQAVSGAGILDEHAISRLPRTSAGPHEVGAINGEELVSLLHCAILASSNSLQILGRRAEIRRRSNSL
jgi:three-Cys-motif partner protein